MGRKQLLIVVLMVATALTGCTRYPLESPSARGTNEALAKRLYAPLEKYFADYTTYPESLSSLVPNYVAELPTTASGHEFQFNGSMRGKQSDSFTIYWYQRNLSDNQVIACSVGGRAAKDGEPFFKTNDCWSLRRPDH